MKIRIAVWLPLFVFFAASPAVLAQSRRKRHRQEPVRTIFGQRDAAEEYTGIH